MNDKETEKQKFRERPRTEWRNNENRNTTLEKRYNIKQWLYWSY